jgi:hypothetical protein
MVDSPGVFVNLPDNMTGKIRNRLATLGILAFPFLIFLAFLIYELNRAPSPGQPLPQTSGHDDSTNAVLPAQSTGTNFTSAP